VLFLESSHFKKLMGVGDKESDGTTTVDVQTFLDAFMNICLRFACFIAKACCLVKSKTSCLSPTLFKCQIIGISKLYDVELTECCCITFVVI
jgi:hypothetical protein